MAVDHGFQPLQETEDAFLVKLNEKNMGPSDYAAALLVEHSLNRQQILAIAPIAWVMEQMWVNRTQPENCRADGVCNESCNCLWLGAGGSGKTYAYTRVLRPLFRRFFGLEGYVVGAPTHAAFVCWARRPKLSTNGAMCTKGVAWIVALENCKEQRRPNREKDRGRPMSTTLARFVLP